MVELSAATLDRRADRVAEGGLDLDARIADLLQPVAQPFGEAALEKQL